METQDDPPLKIKLTNIAKNGDSNYKILYNTKWKEVTYILKQGNVSSNDEEKVKKVNREVIELTKEEVREKMKIELDKYFNNKKLSNTEIFQTTLNELLTEYGNRLSIGKTLSIGEEILMNEIDAYKLKRSQPSRLQTMFNWIPWSNKTPQTQQTPQSPAKASLGGKRKSKKRSTRKPKRRNRRSRSKK